MHRRQIPVLGGATLAYVLATTTVALAAPGPKVTVRVEGKTHTLLAPAVVKTQTGSITKGGAPAGACSATSAAGALDLATHHHWGAKFFTSFGDYLITTILRETESSTSFYWGFWIDNRYSSTGVCSTKLHRGDSLLFAVDSVAHHDHPMAIRAPGSARVSHAFAVKVVWFSDAGVSKPLAGAKVTGTGGASAITNAKGIARFFPSTAGRLVFHARHSGYIRAAAVRVRVSA